MDIYQTGLHGVLTDQDKGYRFASDLCDESTKAHVQRELSTTGGALVSTDVQVVFDALNSDI